MGLLTVIDALGWLQAGNRTEETKENGSRCPEARPTERKEAKKRNLVSRQQKGHPSTARAKPMQALLTSNDAQNLLMYSL